MHPRTRARSCGWLRWYIVRTAFLQQNTSSKCTLPHSQLQNKNCLNRHQSFCCHPQLVTAAELRAGNLWRMASFVACHLADLPCNFLGPFHPRLVLKQCTGLKRLSWVLRMPQFWSVYCLLAGFKTKSNPQTQPFLTAVLHSLNIWGDKETLEVGPVNTANSSAFQEFLLQWSSDPFCSPQ